MPNKKQTAVQELTQASSAAPSVGIIFPPDRLSLTPLETAGALGVSRQYIYVLLGLGELTSFHVGRSRKIVASSVADYVQRRLDAEGPPRMRTADPVDPKPAVDGHRAVEALEFAETRRVAKAAAGTEAAKAASRRAIIAPTASTATKSAKSNASRTSRSRSPAAKATRTTKADRQSV